MAFALPLMTALLFDNLAVSCLLHKRGTNCGNEFLLAEENESAKQACEPVKL